MKQKGKEDEHMKGGGHMERNWAHGKKLDTWKGA